MNTINTLKNYSGRLTWCTALLFSVLLAGCGSGGSGQDPVLGGVGVGSGGGTPPPVVIIPGASCSVASGVTIPTVIVSDPTSGNQAVSTSTSGVAGSGKLVTATFDMAMNAATIDATSFTLTPLAGAVLVPASVNYDSVSKVATLTTAAALLPATTYTADITVAVTSSTAVPLACAYRWTFKTATPAATGQAPVILGATSIYGVLSNTGVTLGGGPGSVTGFRVIGDVGIYPAGACVGCDNTTVNGLIQNGTVPAQDAMTALTAAYNDAIGRATNLCTIVGAGDMSINPAPACGGTANGTFTPGLYWSASSMAIPAGFTITLDAQNDADAVFIFQSESTINSIGGNTHIILANQAQAKNVFWVAKSSSTIGGTTSDFAGTVIALVAVTVNTGTNMLGRAFARTAAVTVQDGALITVPAP